MTLTIILGLYLMEQDLMSSGSKLVCGYAHDESRIYGGEAGLHLCKWILLVMLSLDTPCLQPEGLETSSP